MNDPYVLLGLARTRAPWFAHLLRWATSGSAPLDFVQSLTADEARAVLGSGRGFSAMLVDERTPGLDRNLIADAERLGVPTFVVLDGPPRRDWDALGCAAVLQAGFSKDELIAELDLRARRVDRGLRRPAHMEVAPEATRTPLIGVTGAGGTGASTIAIALAQSLAAGAQGAVALADGCRGGDQAMYHDVGDIIPGLPELAELHRVDQPDPEAVRALLHRTGTRGYDLLLGLRTPRDWVAMRAATVRSTLHGLERSYRWVVVDHDPDAEGEDTTGSLGVEDRHAITRAVITRADLVLVVGTDELKGIHSLARLASSLIDAGLPPHRLLPVVNRSGRNPAHRASVTRSIARLSEQDGVMLQPPVFVGHVRSMDSVHNVVGRLPERMCRPLERACRRALLAAGMRATPETGPARVRIGELGTRNDGSWSERQRTDVA
jgi:cellulose biosynthesis protein BcsQ